MKIRIKRFKGTEQDYETTVHPVMMQGLLDVSILLVKDDAKNYGIDFEALPYISNSETIMLKLRDYFEKKGNYKLPNNAVGFVRITYYMLNSGLCDFWIIYDGSMAIGFILMGYLEEYTVAIRDSDIKKEVFSQAYIYPHYRNKGIMGRSIRKIIKTEGLIRIYSESPNELGLRLIHSLRKHKNSKHVKYKGVKVKAEPYSYKLFDI